MPIKAKQLLAFALFVFCFLASPSVYAAQVVTITEGTEVRLRLLEKLSSGSASEGQRFNLELDDDLRVDGVVVVPRGAKALGTVIHAKKRGFMGKGGELNIMIDSLVSG